jgi:hypothetical protein
VRGALSGIGYVYIVIPLNKTEKMMYNRAVLKLQFQNSFLQKQRVLQPSWRETA